MIRRFSAIDSQGRAFVSPNVFISVLGPPKFRDLGAFSEGLNGFSSPLLTFDPGNSFTITTQNLPAFLEVTSTGRISNIVDDLPAGSFPFKVIASDASGIRGEKNYTFVVNANPRIDNFTIATVQGRPATINPVNLATDPDNNTLQLASITTPTNGTVGFDDEGNIVVLDDTQVEASELFTVQIVGAGGLRIGTPRAVAVFVQDNEVADLTSVQQIKKKGAVTSLVLNLNTAINPADLAGSVIEVRTAGRDKTFGTRDDKLTPAIVSYVPGQTTVTVRFRKPLPKRTRHQLRFRSPVRTVFGATLQPAARLFQS